MFPKPLREGLPRSLGLVSADLQGSLGPSLTRYTDEVADRRTLPSSKVINDPVWRTVRIEAWEVVIVDSPAFQRLRGVHQLGLAGLVYPGASYSRFEHSIGVLHQCQRIIESINRNAVEYATRSKLPSQEPVPRADQILLRLTALVHDIGHGFLSHVSERAIQRIQLDDGTSVRDLCREAKRHFKTRQSEAPPPGELLSCLIVLLPEFRRLLKVASVPCWRDSDTLADHIGDLIIGARDNARPFLSEIISGAIDADKLDYMPRDCKMAGLPMPVDVDRLLEKTHVVRVPASGPLAEYAEQTGLKESDTVEVLAVEPSGGRAFEELVLNRVLLYEKLYNHQKVRAAEGMIENALDLLTKAHPSFGKLSTYLTLSDAEFLSGHWGPEVPSADGAALAKAKEIVRSINVRQLFVRAFAFGPTLVTSPTDDEDTHAQAWRRLKDHVERGRSQKATEFRNRLLAKTKDYLNAVSQPALASALEPHHLIIDLPDVQGIAKNTRLFIGDEHFGVDLYNKLFRVDRWSEAFENRKIIGFVYCPQEYAVTLNLATRDLMKELANGIEFGDWSWRLAKVSIDELVQKSELLTARGVQTSEVKRPAGMIEQAKYLDGRSRRLAIIARYADVMSGLGLRFQTFQPANGDRVTESSIREWLSQFEPEAVPLAVNVLQHVEYWDRAALADCVRQAILDGVVSISDSQWLALGGPTTSSRLVGYGLPDAAPEIKVLTGPEEVDPARELILYDDNVGSGGQGRTVLQQWRGVPEGDWLVKEQHVNALPSSVLGNLGRCKITFLFATGRRKGLQALITHARSLLGSTNIGGYIVKPSDLSCFQSAAQVFENVESSQRARGVFEEAGRRALAGKIGTWSSEKISDRLLGYGNLGGLTVFHYNVPTTTLTCLWQSADSGTLPWRPLFYRRPRID